MLNILLTFFRYTYIYIYISVFFGSFLFVLLCFGMILVWFRFRFVIRFGRFCLSFVFDDYFTPYAVVFSSLEKISQSKCELQLNQIYMILAKRSRRSNNSSGGKNSEKKQYKSNGRSTVTTKCVIVYYRRVDVAVIVTRSTKMYYC